MLHWLATYAVPVNLVVLMLVAGTEIRRSNIEDARLAKPAITAALGQLIVLPAIAIILVRIAGFHPVVGAGLVILSLCPGGGISNAYCYLARCNVFLSALMTAAGILLCLLTIPAWIVVLPMLEFHLDPAHAGTVLAHLVTLVIIPLAIGALARDLASDAVKRISDPLRLLSLGMVATILVTALASVASQAPEIFLDTAIAAGLFVVMAMMFGAALGHYFTDEERHVIVIESGVRNIALALTLGGLTMKDAEFSQFAAFLTGYLAVEIVIMLPYAALIARRRIPFGTTARP